MQCEWYLNVELCITCVFLVQNAHVSGVLLGVCLYLLHQACKLCYRRNLRNVNWTSKTNNLMSYPMRRSYNSCCCLMQIYRITCPHYQIKMITSTNIMQVNRVHHHDSLTQSWDRQQFWATWFKLKDEVHCSIMRWSKKQHCSATLKSWCYYSWSKGTPHQSVIFAIKLLVLLLTSCAAYVLFYTSRWTALQDEAASLKSTIDTNSARKVLCSPLFVPRQELVMSVVREWRNQTGGQQKLEWCTRTLQEDIDDMLETVEQGDSNGLPAHIKGQQEDRIECTSSSRMHAWLHQTYC